MMTCRPIAANMTATKIVSPSRPAYKLFFNGLIYDLIYFASRWVLFIVNWITIPSQDSLVDLTLEAFLFGLRIIICLTLSPMIIERSNICFLYCIWAANLLSQFKVNSAWYTATEAKMLSHALCINTNLPIVWYRDLVTSYQSRFSSSPEFPLRSCYVPSYVTPPSSVSSESPCISDWWLLPYFLESAPKRSRSDSPSLGGEKPINLVQNLDKCCISAHCFRECRDRRSVWACLVPYGVRQLGQATPMADSSRKVVSSGLLHWVHGRYRAKWSPDVTAKIIELGFAILYVTPVIWRAILLLPAQSLADFLASAVMRDCL